MIRAIGSRPAIRAPSSDTMSAAPAPSFRGDEFPAVTVPPSTKAGLSLPSFSSEVSARMFSSRSSSVPGTGITHSP